MNIQVQAQINYFISTNQIKSSSWAQALCDSCFDDALQLHNFYISPASEAILARLQGQGRLSACDLVADKSYRTLFSYSALDMAPFLCLL